MLWFVLEHEFMHIPVCLCDCVCVCVFVCVHIILSVFVWFEIAFVLFYGMSICMHACAYKSLVSLPNKRSS